MAMLPTPLSLSQSNENWGRAALNGTVAVPLADIVAEVDTGVHLLNGDGVPRNVPVRAAARTGWPELAHRHRQSGICSPTHAAAGAGGGQVQVPAGQGQAAQRRSSSSGGCRKLRRGRGWRRALRRGRRRRQAGLKFLLGAAKRDSPEALEKLMVFQAACRHSRV